VNFARTWPAQTGKARQVIRASRRRFRRELLTRDETQRIAANIAKPPELLRRPYSLATRSPWR
jgi:hypothetical protein